MPFNLWLRKMAWERLIMMRRRHLGAQCRAAGCEFPLPDRSSAVGRSLLADDPSPSQQAGQQELAQRVRRAISQLPDQDREILLMRTYERMSYEEIAELLAIEPAAARKRHGRALVRLHRVLSAAGVTESQL
jgi:RNA polymerase sigma-70 factor (ECF subfamily)